MRTSGKVSIKRLAAVGSIVLVMALVLTFLPFGVRINTGGLLSISLNQAGANPDWLTGWDYRKEITVTNARADYQTVVLIGKTADAVGEDVDCGGHIADDFDDLRFTGADETTLLDYWIESIVDSGGTKLATVWVQNNDIPDTTPYMYYGGTETPVSSGADTFIQYHGAATGDYLDSLDLPGGTSFHYRTKIKVGASDAQLFHCGVANIGDKSDDLVMLQTYQFTNLNYVGSYNEGVVGFDSEAPWWGYNTYHIGDALFLAGSKLQGFVDDNQIGSDVTTNLANEAMGLYLTVVWGSVVQDWSFIAKYAATEPSFAFGSEETEPAEPEITNTPDNYNFGILATSTTGNTIINYFTLNNTGNCTVDVTIQGTDLASNTTLYEYYNTGADSEDLVYGNYWAGQTFTPSVTHIVTSVKLRMRRTSGSGNVIVSIRNTSGGKPIGEDLCSGQLDASSWDSNPAWFIFSMGAGATLTADTQYAIVARPTDTLWAYWSLDWSSSTYTGGTEVASTDGGAGWTIKITEDNMFEEWGEITWALSDTATPGENIYGLYAGLDDDDDLFDVIVKKTETYNTLVSGLAEDATQDWGLKLWMPTSVNGYGGQNMTGVITLVASAAS